MPTVTLPPKKRGDEPVVFADVRSIIVVGANGTGKTRLGTYIEQSAGAKAHRISAQRSLSVPSFVQPRAYEQAESSLLYGHYDPKWTNEQRCAQRRGNRWANDPDAHLLNDYEHLLALLFADEARRNREYARTALTIVPTAHPPKCRLDALSDIWKAVMPQRQMIVMDDRLQAQAANGKAYEARQMSDGERVAIYLIGQALCAPADGVVIIDEPEIHLHRAIQGPLWDEIEAIRTDCTFVYITHDLDFAATRIGARRIWLREYDGNSWTWEEVGAAAGSDALAMQVLGSRRPVLFVEGGGTSLDAAIYTALYPREHVIPRQSCEKVIEATKAMTALSDLHHLRVRGLVDRDRRGDEEVAALNAAGVGVVGVAEIENLLCVPEAIMAVAEQLKKDDPTVAVATAKKAVLDEFRKLGDSQALARALGELQFRLNGFGPKVSKSDASTLDAELKAYVEAIDVPAIVAQAKSLVQNCLVRDDYLLTLRYFNCKGVVAFVSGSLGISADVYVGVVMGILKQDSSGAVGEAMRALVPSS